MAWKAKNGAKLTEIRRERRRIEDVLLGFRMVRKEALQEGSWIRTIRKALGIPEAELARVMGYEPRSIYRMEQSESKATLQVKYLHKAAKAMKCDLVYAIVPKAGTLEELARELEEARYEIQGDDERAGLRREIWKVVKAGTKGLRD